MLREERRAERGPRFTLDNNNKSTDGIDGVQFDNIPLYSPLLLSSSLLSSSLLSPLPSSPPLYKKKKEKEKKKKRAILGQEGQIVKSGPPKTV